MCRRVRRRWCGSIWLVECAGLLLCGGGFVGERIDGGEIDDEVG